MYAMVFVFRLKNIKKWQVKKQYGKETLPVEPIDFYKKVRIAICLYNADYTRVADLYRRIMKNQWVQWASVNEGFIPLRK